MQRKPKNRGAALLMCLFMILMVASLVTSVLDTETLQLAATRNTIEYEQALYWANAGVHRACAELTTNAAYRGTLTEGTLPPNASPSGFSVTVADDVSNIRVTATGYSGRGMRTVQANVEL
ncbi:MAG: hypothetical protein AAFV43_08585 [Planctomycetota bacterium]